MSRAIDSLVSFIHSFRLPPTNEGRIILAVGTAAVLGTSTFLLPLAYKDYRIFKSYGQGGVPNNFLGWVLVRVFFQGFGREMLSTNEYGQRDSEGFLNLSPAQIAQRAGEVRPAIGPHVVPQRQLTKLPERDIMLKLRETVDAFVRRNPHLVKFQRSNLERHADGIFVADHIPQTDIVKTMNGEVAHVHSGNDHSLHVVLSPADCKKVIDAGWAQRHAFSGTRAMTFLALGTKPDLPSEYLIIYAPRTEAEIETVMAIVAASVKFTTGREDVQ